MKKTTRTRTARAPLMIRTLMKTILQPGDVTMIDRAYGEAQTLLDSDDALSAIGAFVQAEGEDYIKGSDPQLLRGDYAREGGTLQAAFQDPGFALGFCLAYFVFDRGRS